LNGSNTAGAPPSAPPEQDDYWNATLKPGEEPVVTGTLFFVVVILMIIGAVWIMVFLELLDR
jgi:hypothetical protein